MWSIRMRAYRNPSREIGIKGLNHSKQVHSSLTTELVVAGPSNIREWLD